MSGDEVVVTMIGAALAVIGWVRWYWLLGRMHRVGARPQGRQALALTPIVLCIALIAILLFYSSSDVQSSMLYMSMYTIVGMGWLAALTILMPLFGLSMRDDVLERGNLAAVPAIVGVMAGWMLGFAGGNIGDGPGWWVVIFCAILSCGTLLSLWVLLHAAHHVNDSITIDRDAATGWRFGGLMAGAGLILGRAVAGDWHSTADTLRDFAQTAWPVLLLLAIELTLGWMLRPRAERRPSTAFSGGIIPAVFYVGVGGVWLIALGWWL
jgi:hypothetical protein